jgi:hypothetical protein
MEKNLSIKCIPWVMAFFSIGCKQVYIPPAIAASNNFLVVDGFINYGPDSTIITLSRSRSLIDSARPIPELNAEVTVEGQGSEKYPLNEVGNGEYGIDQLNLNINQLYRIRITTNAGEQYLSDFVPVKLTPAIDSINWIRQDDGVHIFVNTHDPTNNTRYYRWEYSETWEYHSPYDSYLEYVNNQVVNRDPSRQVFACWSTLNATNILMASSANLTQDIIYKNPLEFISVGSEKVTIKYSILVKQFALTKEAFEYWQNLRKSTEQVGGLFDAQPSQITGNIHSVDHPGQPVLGYISASSRVENRIYITNAEVWPWVDNLFCTTINVRIDSVDYYFGVNGYIPISRISFLISPLLPPVNGYLASTGPCVDCTQRGGSNVKPSFWP